MTFLASETTGVMATLYPRTGELIYLLTGTNLVPPTINTGDAHEIVSASTSKSMGGGGQFTIELKSTLPFLAIDANTWIDITFVVNGKEYHTMRGLVNSIQQRDSSSGGGSTVWVLEGKDHTAVFEKTRAWFNNRTEGDLAFKANLARQVYRRDGVGAVGVQELVRKSIYGFIEALEDVGRSNWDLPQAMFGVQSSQFTDNFVYDTENASTEPRRRAMTTNLIAPDGENVWELAQEFSDPTFFELDCVLGTRDISSVIPKPGQSIPHGKGVMYVRLRDRPWPTLAKGIRSNYFNNSICPILELHKYDLTNSSFVISDAQRFNTFILSQTLPSGKAAASELFQALWDEESIRQHGHRVMQVSSRYGFDVQNNANRLEAAIALRTQMRDWHAISAYLRSGTATAGRLIPDARIGQRLRIIDRDGVPETFYMEGVAHTFSMPAGGRTNFTLTRGFRGSDSNHLRALQRLANGYQGREA